MRRACAGGSPQCPTPYVVSKWLAGLLSPRPTAIRHLQICDKPQPRINYRHIPVRGLFELNRLTDELKRRLPNVACPVTIIQRADDHVVDPKSGELIVENVGSEVKSLHMIPSKRHGILNENTGGTQELVVSFLTSLPATEPASPKKAARLAPGENDVRSAV